MKRLFAVLVLAAAAALAACTPSDTGSSPGGLESPSLVSPGGLESPSMIESPSAAPSAS